MWRCWTVGTGWRAWLVGRRGEVGPEVEELVLDGRQLGGQPLAQADREGHPDVRVELVDRAVGLHPERVLGDALAATQPGHPFVAGLGVDPVEAWHATIVPHAAAPRGADGRVSAFAALGHPCYHPSVIEMEDNTSHVVYGGTSAARAGREAGDHHRVCHQGR